MMTAQKGDSFASLFKKYRLRSEIETLSQFADLLAKEGFVYETSLFSRWQKGERIPNDRTTLLTVIKIFANKKGINSLREANELMVGAGQGNLTDLEIQNLPGTFSEIPYKIPLASVAELLRTYRVQKNISQYEMALSLGFNNTEKIVQIEEGALERPPRKLIDEICEILKLQENEKNSLLLAGNYLPTRKEINMIRQRVEPILENWSYPALLYDFSWRIIMTNKKILRTLGLTETDKRNIYQTTPTAIEIVFDPGFINNKYLKGEDLGIWHKNLLRFIVHFRALHKSITKEKWYIDLIKRMMKNELFREVWKKAQRIDNNLLATRYGYKVFYDPRSNTKLKFNIFVVPLLSDPRFELEFFTPANSDTLLYFQKEV